MTTRKIIDIPNHPILKDVIRKAQVFRGYYEYDTNRVIIPVKIFHYLDGVEIKYLPGGTDETYAELISDNETKVNPQTGEIVEKDENGEYPEGTMGEYDYLWYLVNIAKLYTPQELEEMYVPLRINKLNSKLYK